MASWREHAAPIIADVIKRVGRQDEKALRKALKDAYPFGERRYWPYKAWLSEIKRQLYGKACRVKAHKSAPGQTDMFAPSARSSGR